MDSMYSLNGALEGNRYASYNFDPTARSPIPLNADSNTTGSTALYHHNGTRYGLGLPVRAGAPAENKLNGFHGGPKHKRGDVDRECTSALEHHCVVLILSFKSQPFCRYPSRGSPRRNTIALQRSTWVPLFAEETGGRCGRTSGYDIPGNICPFCGTDDRYTRINFPFPSLTTVGL